MHSRPMPAIIRRATLNDLDALVQRRLELLRAMGDLPDGDCTPEVAEVIRRYLISKMPNDEFIAWVAEADGSIVGTSGLVFFERPPMQDHLSGIDAYVMNMYTLPKWRGKGIATALLGEIINYVKGTAAGRIWLHTTDDGRHIYQQLGFVSTSSEMELVW